MQKLVKVAAIIGVTATLVACGGAPAQEEVVIVPVQPEPVTTKY